MLNDLKSNYQTIHQIAILSVFAILSTAFSDIAHAGWFERATGRRTPRPIRKIAPNGVRIFRRAPEANSADTWDGESAPVYRISEDGTVYVRQQYNHGGSSNWRKDGSANLTHNAAGQAYWVYRGAENSPLRVPRLDRQQVARLANNYRSNYGTVYLSQQGNRVSGKIHYASGRVGTFAGTISGNQLNLNWQNGSDHGQAWLNIDGRGNLAGPFRSNYNGKGGNWSLWR